MHQTKPIIPVVLHDNLSPCKVINQNFIKHENLIQKEIEKNPEILKPFYCPPHGWPL